MDSFGAASIHQQARVLLPTPIGLLVLGEYLLGHVEQQIAANHEVMSQPNPANPSRTIGHMARSVTGEAQATFLDIRAKIAGLLKPGADGPLSVAEARRVLKEQTARCTEQMQKLYGLADLSRADRIPPGTQLQARYDRTATQILDAGAGLIRLVGGRDLSSQAQWFRTGLAVATYRDLLGDFFSSPPHWRSTRLAKLAPDGTRRQRLWHAVHAQGGVLAIAPGPGIIAGDVLVHLRAIRLPDGHHVWAVGDPRCDFYQYYPIADLPGDYRLYIAPPGPRVTLKVGPGPQRPVHLFADIEPGQDLVDNFKVTMPGLLIVWAHGKDGGLAVPPATLTPWVEQAKDDHGVTRAVLMACDQHNAGTFKDTHLLPTAAVPGYPMFVNTLSGSVFAGNAAVTADKKLVVTSPPTAGVMYWYDLGTGQPAPVTDPAQSPVPLLSAEDAAAHRGTGWGRLGPAGAAGTPGGNRAFSPTGPSGPAPLTTAPLPRASLDPAPPGLPTRNGHTPHNQNGHTPHNQEAPRGNGEWLAARPAPALSHTPRHAPAPGAQAAMPLDPVLAGGGVAAAVLGSGGWRRRADAGGCAGAAGGYRAHSGPGRPARRRAAQGCQCGSSGGGAWRRVLVTGHTRYSALTARLDARTAGERQRHAGGAAAAAGPDNGAGGIARRCGRVRRAMGERDGCATHP